MGAKITPNQTLSDVDRAQQLITVTPLDQPLAPLDKAACHAGDGVLHRAFSVFLLDEHGRVLLQQRSADKPLWPGYWANSCCSHPRWGEELDAAVQRRVVEELGAPMLDAPHRHFHFIYHARYGSIGSEHELCHVYTARMGAADPRPAPEEVADWRWVTPDELDRVLADPQAPYTPWLRLEWPRLRGMLDSSRHSDSPR